MAADDAAKYAEALRLSLINDLFDGEDVGLEEQAADELTVEDYIGNTGELTLQDIDRDLDEFQDHEFIRGILEQGRVLKEYSRDIDDKLRQAEMESIQEYIQESDNMVALHDQVQLRCGR
jgi:vacuolar protein sorting-associated protein 52